MSSNPNPAASHMLLRFLITWVVSSSIDPSTRFPVFGSKGICPDIKIRSRVLTACEYGPIAWGAFCVRLLP